MPPGSTNRPLATGYGLCSSIKQGAASCVILACVVETWLSLLLSSFSSSNSKKTLPMLILSSAAFTAAVMMMILLVDGCLIEGDYYKDNGARNDASMTVHGVLEGAGV